MNVGFRHLWVTLALLMVLPIAPSWAQNSGAVTGTVVDPLGARVGGAAVKLLKAQGREGRRVRRQGDFTFERWPRPLSDRSQRRGFQTRTTDPMFVGGGARVTVEVALPIGPLEESVSVTAAATDVLPSQIGAPVTVLDATDARAARQDRRARSAASRAGRLAGPDRRARRRHVDLHPRRQLQFQQGADRRHSGQRHRRRRRSVAVLDGRRRAHRSAARRRTASIVGTDALAGVDQHHLAARPHAGSRGDRSRSTAAISARNHESASLGGTVRPLRLLQRVRAPRHRQRPAEQQVPEQDLRRPVRRRRSATAPTSAAPSAGSIAGSNRRTASASTARRTMRSRPTG